MLRRLLRKLRRFLGWGSRIRVVDVQKKIFVRTRSNKLKRLRRIFIRIRRKS